MQHHQKPANKNIQDPNGSRQAVLFARVSTARQGKEGLSLREIQLPRMREYAKEYNLKIAKEYKVNETGGQYKTRKKFNEMVEYVKENDFITDVIAFRVDRITRNPRDAVIIDELRSKYHKRIHFIDDNFILDENSGRNDLFQWDAKVLFARQYLEGVKEDGVNSKISKLEKGELPWKAPYGYKNQKHVPPRQRVVPVEPEASIVREIFEEYATDAYSCRSLAKEMQLRYGGMGQKFNGKKICCILNNPFYMGQIYDEDTETLYPHIHPTLIASEVFTECGEILTKNGDTHHRSFSNTPAIYRGLIKCGCGCDVTPDFKDKIQKNGNTHHYDYYHCSNTKGAHQTQHNITEQSINAKVSECLSKMILSEKHLQDLSEKIAAKHTAQINFYNGERAKLAKQRGLIKQRQQNTYDKMADLVISDNEYKENNQRYQEELAKIQEEENRLNYVDETIYSMPQYLRELVNHIVALFNAGRLNEKQKILSILFEAIQLDGEVIEPIIRPDLTSFFA